MAVTTIATAEMSERIMKRATSRVTRTVRTTLVTDAMGVGAVTTGVMAITAAMAVMVTMPIRQVTSKAIAKATTVTDATTDAMAETAASSGGRFLTKPNDKCRFLTGIYLSQIKILAAKSLSCFKTKVAVSFKKKVGCLRPG